MERKIEMSGCSKKGAILRGDVFYATLRGAEGSEQGGTRPVVIIQNDTGNRYSPTFVVAPITSSGIKNKKALPTHVKVGTVVGLEKDSVVLLEQIRTLNKERFGEFITTLQADTMKCIDGAICVSVGLAQPKIKTVEGKEVA